MSEQRTKVAIIGSGNIGTDLMIKMLRISKTLECAAMVGIDPESDGLARAARFKVPTTHEGVDGLIAMDDFDEIDIVFDATSAGAHRVNAAKLTPYGKKLVDLTPAAIGPFVVPVVNLETHEDADNVNMVTCGGQATIPIVVRRLAGHRRALRRDRGLRRVEVGRSGHPRQHRRVHRDHRPWRGGGRRRLAGQGDHHPQPRRAAADHARHRVLPDQRSRRAGAGRDPGVDRADRRRRSRSTSPAIG